MSDVIERLRAACRQLRQKPLPLADLIPLIQQAADENERLLAELAAAQPAQEPVAWQLPGTDNIISAQMKSYLGVRAEMWTRPLYANPPQQRKPDDPWRNLYRRAINEANGLTNYAEDRPELRSAERRISKIEDDARAIERAHGIKEAP